MIRLLAADDHPVIRQGLKQILEDTPDIVVVAEASTGDEVLAQVGNGNFDLVILDISMPGKRWLDVIREARAIEPGLLFLVLSRHAEVQFALESLKAGASGYLTKTSLVNEFINAVRRVASGSRYISSDLAGDMAEAVGAWQRLYEQPHELLSSNESQVVRLIIKGRTIKEIAVEMSVSQSTASTYKARAMRKLNVKSDADLIRYGLQHEISD
ncbi:MAG: response regulator transcription factor [Dehalococcoidia bacterium]